MEPLVGRCQWRRNVTWSSVTLSMPWPAPPFALACPDSKAKCAALSEPSAADRCNEPETETAEALSSVLLGCDARPCTYLDVTLVATWASLRAWRRRTARTPSALRRTR